MKGSMHLSTLNSSTDASAVNLTLLEPHLQQVTRFRFLLLRIICVIFCVSSTVKFLLLFICQLEQNKSRCL